MARAPWRRHPGHRNHPSFSHTAQPTWKRQSVLSSRRGDHAALPAARRARDRREDRPAQVTPTARPRNTSPSAGQAAAQLVVVQRQPRDVRGDQGRGAGLDRRSGGRHPPVGGLHPGRSPRILLASWTYAPARDQLAVRRPGQGRPPRRRSPSAPGSPAPAALEVAASHPDYTTDDQKRALLGLDGRRQPARRTGNSLAIARGELDATASPGRPPGTTRRPPARRGGGRHRT